MRNVAIVGSREWKDIVAIHKFIDILCPEIHCIVSGAGRGVDREAELYARSKGFETLIFPAEWDRYGRSAGFRRNVTIVENSDVVYAFWDEVSRGTKHTMDTAKAKGLTVFFYSEGDFKEF
jgi:hypothetical protein